MAAPDSPWGGPRAAGGRSVGAQISKFPSRWRGRAQPRGSPRAVVGRKALSPSGHIQQQLLTAAGHEGRRLRHRTRPPRRGVPPPRPGRQPEILVRRAAHSPRSCRFPTTITPSASRAAPGAPRTRSARARLPPAPGSPAGAVPRTTQSRAVSGHCACLPGAATSSRPPTVSLSSHPSSSILVSRCFRNPRSTKPGGLSISPGFAGNSSLTMSEGYSVVLPEDGHLTASAPTPCEMQDMPVAWRSVGRWLKVLVMCVSRDNSRDS